MHLGDLNLSNVVNPLPTGVKAIADSSNGSLSSPSIGEVFPQASLEPISSLFHINVILDFEICSLGGVDPTLDPHSVMHLVKLSSVSHFPRPMSASRWDFLVDQRRAICLPMQGDMSSTPSLGRLHLPRGKEAWEPQLLKPEARPCALHDEEATTVKSSTPQ